MTEYAEKTSINSESASIKRGQKTVRIALNISIVTFLLQFSSLLGFSFDLLKFVNWVLPFVEFLVPSFFILPFLYYFVLHGHRWARWSFVFIVWLIGLSFLISALTNFIVEIQRLRLDEGYFFEILIHFVLALAQLTVSSSLVFSESVGDFFDFQRGRIVEDHWNQFGKAKKTANTQRSFDRKTIYLNLNRRDTVGQLVPKMTIVFVFLGWILFVIYLYYKPDIIHDSIWGEPLSKNTWAAVGEMIGKGVTEIFDVIEVVVIGYLALFVFPTLIVLPLLIPLSFSWRKPIHFLLLRPFNRSWITGKLRSTIQKELASLGHCYTLADLNIRVPLYIRVPFLFGQVSLFHFRLLKIRRPKHITRLVNGMNRLFIRNLNWYLSRDKLFPVACSNSGWRACVGRLVKEVDVIIIDISGITENIIWEIELLKDLGAISRSIFLVSESERLKSEPVLFQLFEDDYHNPKLFTYPISHASNSGAIQSAAVKILCS